MAGPAYLSPLPSPHLPGLSLWQVPPISFLSLPHTNLSLSYRPGLSLWQVPPSLSSTFPTPIFPLPTGLSLWQVPPISFLYLPHTNLSPSYRPGLSLWQVPPISFLFLFHTSPFSLSYRPLSLSSTSPTLISPYPIGPACHCGRSRLFPSPPSPHLPPFFLYLIGPACHCGRSRLFSLPLLFPPPFFWVIYLFPLALVGPACHCGRSRQFPDFLIFPLVAKNFILSYPHRSLPIPANLQNFCLALDPSPKYHRLPQIFTDPHKS